MWPLDSEARGRIKAFIRAPPKTPLPLSTFAPLLFVLTEFTLASHPPTPHRDSRLQIPPMASSTKAESIHSDDVVVVMESEKTSYFNTTEQEQSGLKEEILVDSAAASSTKGSSSEEHVDVEPSAAPEVPGAGTLPFREVIVVFSGLVLGVFLSSLDQTIVNVCSTKIASEFHSLIEIPWLGTAYFLTSTAFQPL